MYTLRIMYNAYQSNSKFGRKLSGSKKELKISTDATVAEHFIKKPSVEN